MPIRPDLRHFYRGPRWQEVRGKILIRAGNKCERCGRPDRVPVLVESGSGKWCADDADGVARWHDIRGAATAAPRCLDFVRLTRTVLTIAHLDHDPADNRDANLAALCQRCHLVHDQRHHYTTRRRRARAGQQYLFEP